MPQVYRISKKEKVSVFISAPIWLRMQKRPNVFSKYKWELAPIPKPPIKKAIIVNDDLAEIPKKKYAEDEYREDLKNARLALKANDKGKALHLYLLAYKFKKSVYVKTKIKELS